MLIIKSNTTHNNSIRSPDLIRIDNLNKAIIEPFYKKYKDNIDISNIHLARKIIIQNIFECFINNTLLTKNKIIRSAIDIYTGYNYGLFNITYSFYCNDNMGIKLPLYDDINYEPYEYLCVLNNEYMNKELKSNFFSLFRIEVLTPIINPYMMHCRLIDDIIKIIEIKITSIDDSSYKPKIIRLWNLSDYEYMLLMKDLLYKEIDIEDLLIEIRYFHDNIDLKKLISIDNDKIYFNNDESYLLNNELHNMMRREHFPYNNNTNSKKRKWYNILFRII